MHAWHQTRNEDPAWWVAGGQQLARTYVSSRPTRTFQRTAGPMPIFDIDLARISMPWLSRMACRQCMFLARRPSAWMVKRNGVGNVGQASGRTPPRPLYGLRENSPFGPDRPLQRWGGQWGAVRYGTSARLARYRGVLLRLPTAWK